MSELVLELSNGQEVELKEVWNCCDGTHDCGSAIEVYDCETNELICKFAGPLPDIDDEDFVMDEYIALVEQEIDYADCDFTDDEFQVYDDSSYHSDDNNSDEDEEFNV